MKTRKVLEKRIKKKKSPTVPAIKSRECCLEDVVFFITTRLKKKPLRWFESAPSELNPVTMIKKKLSNFVLDGRQRKVCVDDCRIYNSLIYKMSAPYRHMMSWRKCKTIFKKIQRINNLDGIAPITKLCVNPSDSFYFLTDESVEFICAFLIFRYLSLCRLRNLCIEAASYCMAQVRRNFFMTENMLLIGLLAKIFEQSKSHILDAVQVYELAVSILHNERFPKDLKALNGYEVDHKCSTNNFEESSLSIFLKATQISNSSINVFMSKEERNISSESLNGDYSKSFEKSNGCNELQQVNLLYDVIKKTTKELDAVLNGFDTS